MQLDIFLSAESRVLPHKALRAAGTHHCCAAGSVRDADFALTPKWSQQQRRYPIAGLSDSTRLSLFHHPGRTRSREYLDALSLTDEAERTKSRAYES
jgi:hypothetical protein